MQFLLFNFKILVNQELLGVIDLYIVMSVPKVAVVLIRSSCIVISLQAICLYSASCLLGDLGQELMGINLAHCWTFEIAFISCFL